MGKIIYFISPLDSSKKKIIESDESVLKILQDFKIEKESLSLTLNGETPDEFDIHYVMQDGDVLEIRRIVHGNSSKGKSNLANIIQIVALIAATVLSFGNTSPLLIAAIAAGGGIAAGALNARAAKLALKEAGNLDSETVEVATNSFSLSQATNDVRPLKPVPLPMGSHVYAPDLHARIFNDYSLGINNSNFVTTDAIFYPGDSPTNGALLPGGSANPDWITMPALYINATLPVYEIKFAPTPNLGGIAAIKTAYLAGFSPFLYTFNVPNDNPIVVYHSDPADPLYGKYDFFSNLAAVSVYTIGYANYAGATGMFGTATHPNLSFITTNDFTVNKFFTFNIYNNNGFYYPTISSVSTVADSLLAHRNYMINVLNNGNVTTSNKDESFAIRTSYISYAVTSVKTEGVPSANHIFNFGVGDSVISQRKLEKIIIPQNASQNWTAIDKAAWALPVGSHSVLSFVESKKLFNGGLGTTTGPETNIELNDFNDYNWVYFDGPPGMFLVSFNFLGYLYRATSSGMAENYVEYEFQIKTNNQTNWTQGTRFFFANNNTKKITNKLTRSPSGFPTSDKFTQVRIRKMTLDSKNNVDERTCDIDLVNITFFEPFNNPDKLRPFNLDAFSVIANSQRQASQNKYNALVETKCWIYDFDTETWSWGLTRNPAFWFLYFAYGGFYNAEAVGAFTYPFSPTYGFVNYPGHPDSTDQIFGVGLTNEQIDIAKILEWAEFCETKELYLDLVLKDDTSCADVLERIANIGRGSVSYYNGLLSVVYEDESQSPTCVFGMGNILAGSFSVDYNVTEKVGIVKGNFVNRNGDWETTQVQATVPYSTEENLKVIEVNLEGVTEEQQAQREVNIMAARQFYQRRMYSWKVDVEGLIAKRGDLVYLSHDSTQYGYSGRIKGFILTGGLITGIETSSILQDDSTSHVTIRYPDNTYEIFQCHVVGNNLIFDETYPIEKASFYISPTVENLLTDYTNSIPEDFIFISGAKETPGKLVRISEIKADKDMNFTISAVDEDPAMWAFEYGDDEPPESFEDVELVLSITNFKVKNLGGGLVRILWEGVNADQVQIINEFSETPIESNGSYSFSGGSVTLELVEGNKYEFRMEPFAIGTPYRAINKRFTVWA